MIRGRPRPHGRHRRRARPARELADHASRSFSRRRRCCTAARPTRARRGTSRTPGAGPPALPRDEFSGSTTTSTPPTRPPGRRPLREDHAGSQTPARRFHFIEIVRDGQLLQLRPRARGDVVLARSTRTSWWNWRRTRWRWTATGESWRSRERAGELRLSGRATPRRCGSRRSTRIASRTSFDPAAAAGLGRPVSRLPVSDNHTFGATNKYPKPL